MTLDFSLLYWPAIGVSFVICQIFSTLWYTIIFGRAWANALGYSKEELAKAHPLVYVGSIASTIVLVISLGLLQTALQVQGIAAGLGFALFVAVGLGLVVGLPGYAFQPKRMKVYLLHYGSQFCIIIIASAIIAAWRG